jgi:hypothetical protein
LTSKRYRVFTVDQECSYHGCAQFPFALVLIYDFNHIGWYWLPYGRLIFSKRAVLCSFKHAWSMLALARLRSCLGFSFWVLVAETNISWESWVWLWLSFPSYMAFCWVVALLKCFLTIQFSQLLAFLWYLRCFLCNFCSLDYVSFYQQVAFVKGSGEMCFFIFQCMPAIICHTFLFFIRFLHVFSG